MVNDVDPLPGDPLQGIGDAKRDAWLRQLFAGQPPDVSAALVAPGAANRRPAFAPPLSLEPAMSVSPANGSHVNPMLGSYELLHTLGKGGMGEVLLAKHVILDLQVAVKVLPPKLQNEHLQGRFRKEMQTLARLAHPNIVRATDGGVFEDVHYLVMEYVRGVDLEQLLRHYGPEKLSVDDICAMMRDAALGLDYAHRRRLVHRDVKPNNIMVSCEGEVKVLDFGLILLQEKPDDLTVGVRVLGARNYMSPEQIRDPHEVDERTDIYSLGVTCFTLLTGNVPGGGKGLAARRDVQPDLAALVTQMMAKEPADRPQTCEEVAARLQQFIGQADLKALWQNYSREAKTAYVQPISSELVAKLSGAFVRPTTEQVKAKVRGWFER